MINPYDLVIILILFTLIFFMRYINIQNQQNQQNQKEIFSTDYKNLSTQDKTNIININC